MTVFTHALSTNNYGPAKFVVATSAANGSHTSLASAMAAAVSGDTIFLRDSVTENVTITPGVNIVNFLGTDNSTISITGKLTMSGAGVSTISGINLMTNSDFAVLVSGNAASVLMLRDCFIYANNNTAISYTSSSASSQINVIQCRGDINNASAAIFASSSAGSLSFFDSDFANSIGSTTANTVSAGNLGYRRTGIANPTSTSGTATFSAVFFQVSTSPTNTKALTCAGSGIHNILLSDFQTGSATSITITNTTVINNCTVGTTNGTAAIDGAGTIQYGEIAFSNTGNLITTTTKTARNISVGSISFDGGTNVLNTYTVGTFTPTMIGTVAGVTTYTAQNGYYVRIGSSVQIQATVSGSAATGTGNAIFGTFPFTVKNQTGGNTPGSMISASSATWAWPAGTTSLAMDALLNTITGVCFVSGTASVGANLQMANAAFTFLYNVTYQI